MSLKLKRKHFSIFQRTILSFPFFFLGYNVVILIWKYISLPPISHFPLGIVSYTTRNEINPLSDYFRLGLLVIISTAMLFWGFTSGFLYLSNFLNYLSSKLFKSNIINSIKQNISRYFERFEKFYLRMKEDWESVSMNGKFIVMLLMVSIIFFNITWNDLSAILLDGFHDGEILGYLPTLKESPGIFQNSFIIHGFGINILPSLVGDILGDQHNRIYFSRLFSHFTSIISFIFLCLSIASATQIYLRGRISWSRVLIVSFLIFCALKFTFYWNIAVRGRDSLFFIQLFIILQLLESFISNNQQKIIRLAVLSGLLLPIGYLNAYDRAIVATLAIAFSLCLIFFIDRRVWKVYLYFTGGIALSLVSLYLFMGKQEIFAALEQIFYWSRTAGSIWDEEITNRSFLVLTIFSLQNIFIICLALVLILFSFFKTVDKKDFLQKHSGLFVLTIISITFLRMSADRSDTSHLFDSTMPSMLIFTFFLSVFALKYLNADFQPKTTSFANLNRRMALLIVFLSLLTCMIYSNPYTSAKRLVGYINSWGTPDSLILAPEYSHSGREMSPLLKNESSFYTLNSEGIWYYIYGIRSISRFHQMLYARTEVFQQEVVNSFKKNPPGFILFSDNSFSSELDSVSIFNSNQIIVSYILKNYKPFRIIDDNWFWKFDSSGFVISSELKGKVVNEEIVASVKKDVLIKGHLSSSLDNSSMKVFYILNCENRELISVQKVEITEGRNSVWSVMLPTTILKPGNNMIEVCVLSDDLKTLYPVCKPIKVNLN